MNRKLVASGAIKTTKGIPMIHGPPGMGQTITTITAIIRCATGEQFFRKLIGVNPEFALTEKILLYTKLCDV